MNKSKFLIQKFTEKSDIAMLCILGMIAGCLVSRALVSIAMVVFGLVALWNINPRRWLQHKWWLLGFVWVMFYALTYFWCANHGDWNTRFQVKLPILLLPLSFAFLPAFTLKQLQTFLVATGLMLLGGIIYSASFFFRNPALYIEKYRISQTLPTPLGQDHIRFSLMITLFIIWMVYIFPQLTSRVVKWLVVILSVIFIAYLHMLAAKSGLIAIYLFFVGWGLYVAISKKKLMGIGIIILLIAFVGLALRYIPTFRQRIGYISYSYIVYKQGDQSGQYGDIGRLISYKIATRIIAHHPLTGVGTGDMLDEMKRGYTRWYPQVSNENRLLPANQFLTVALGCGIPLAMLFAVWAFMPLAWLRRNRASFFFFVVWAILFLQLLIEPVLEVQYGVFVYLFFLLWQKETLRPKTNATPASV